jgi:hypothetical protein
MNPRTEKKRKARPEASQSVERFHLDTFLRLMPTIGNGHREYGGKPDLLLHGNEHRLGVEHTRLFQPQHPPLQERESLENRLVAKAWKIYSSDATGFPLNLSVCFDERESLRKEDINPYATRLASTVRRLDKAIGDADYLERFLVFETWRLNKEWPQALPEVIGELLYERVSKKEYELWSTPRSCMLPALSKTQIQARLDHKEKKLPWYRQTCDSVWLLIVLDGGSPATYQSVDDGLFTLRYTSSFDRVFLMERFSEKLHELKLIPVG